MSSVVNLPALELILHGYPVLGGVICGMAVFLGMNLVVLPLSAVPFPIGPFSVEALRKGLGFHVILVGLPISTSL